MRSSVLSYCKYMCSRPEAGCASGRGVELYAIAMCYSMPTGVGVLYDIAMCYTKGVSIMRM